MRFRYAVSYESDTSPIETLRGELDARDARQAALRGGREAFKHWPKGRHFRSVVVVIERLDAAEATNAADVAAYTLAFHLELLEHLTPGSRWQTSRFWSQKRGHL